MRLFHLIAPALLFMMAAKMFPTLAAPFRARQTRPAQ